MCLHSVRGTIKLVSLSHQHIHMNHSFSNYLIVTVCLSSQKNNSPTGEDENNHDQSELSSAPEKKNRFIRGWLPNPAPVGRWCPYPSYNPIIVPVLNYVANRNLKTGAGFRNHPTGCAFRNHPTGCAFRNFRDFSHQNRDHWGTKPTEKWRYGWDIYDSPTTW